MRNAIASKSTQVVPRHRTTFLDLNDDVLAMIVSDFTTKDCLQLSLVARRVHLLAKRQALSSVTMGSVQAVKRVCRYMLEDVVGRLQWIRRLSVSALIPDQGSGRSSDFLRRVWPRKEPIAMGLLVSLLKQANGLQYLHVGYVDNNLEFDHALLDAMCALPNLVELELLGGGGSETLKLLDGIGSRPRSLMLEVQSNNADRDAIISQIGRLQELRTLCLDGIYTPQDSDSTNTVPFIRNLRYTWPNITDLTLTHCEIHLPAVLRAFPNLRALTFAEWGNLRFAVPDRPEYSVQPRGPASLEYVEGSGHLFENWPTGRPVYHILIQSMLAIPSRWAMDGPTRCGDPEIPILLQMVRHAEPVILTFRIMAFESLRETFWKSLAAGATRLRCLEIELFLFSETQGLMSVFLQWMTKVPSSLSPITSLLYLEVALDCSTWRCFSCGETPEPILDQSQECAERFASLVVAQIPSIRYVSLGFGHMASHIHPVHTQPFTGKLWMWKVENTGGRRSLYLVSPNAAQRLKALLKSPLPLYPSARE
ncbi:predicted protein [Postia placenta Mad-698-R]|nr:predicted protein [Postia placenta Mad-698-R]